MITYIIITNNRPGYFLMFILIYSLGVVTVILTALVLSGYFTLEVYAMLKGSPYVPTSDKQVDKILRPLALKRGQLFVELGSGDGRVVRHACSHYHTRGIGYEVNPWLYWYSMILTKIYTIKNIEFRLANFYNADISGADIIFLFLLPDTIKKLSTKLQHESKSGAIIVSHGFKLPALHQFQVKQLSGTPFSTYYYKVSK